MHFFSKLVGSMAVGLGLNGVELVDKSVEINLGEFIYVPLMRYTVTKGGYFKSIHFKSSTKLKLICQSTMFSLRPVHLKS